LGADGWNALTQRIHALAKPTQWIFAVADAPLQALSTSHLASLFFVIYDLWPAVFSTKPWINA
jgi:hypothetical protein